jgi:TolB-like protein/Flp pilus assembly protein TadD
LLLQLTEVLTELLEIGPEAGKIVIVLLIVGFVPALILAWAFELTPDGIKREADVDREQSITPQTGQKLNYAIIAMLVLVAAYFIYEARFKDPGPAPGKDLESLVSDADPGTQGTPAIEAETSGQSDSPAGDSEQSIVVLPFVNMSADPEQEFFSDGLSEEILNALAQLEGLRVISRTSAFAFKDKDLSIPEIAAQLDVSHVLEGSVRSAGGDVRITAQLIEVRSDSHLWSKAYSRKLENVFEIQEEISLAIADALHVTLSDGATSTRPTENLKAYDAFLRGRHLYQRRENLDLAVNYLEKAVELDPGFTDAWANMAAAQVINSWWKPQDTEALIERSKFAAEKAIDLDPANGFAHAVLGLQHFYALNYEDAIASLRMAIELNPNESNSYLWLAIALASLGYIDEATDLLVRAERIDPAFSNLHNWLASMYVISGHYDLARKHEIRALNLDPAFILDQTGALARANGDIDESERLNLFVYNDSPAAQALVKAFHDALRDPSRVQEFLALNREIDPNDEGGLANTGGWHSFRYLYHLGEVEEALSELTKVRAAGHAARATADLSTLWAAADRENLSHPAIGLFFEEWGFTDYWRKHGDPDYCRVTATGLECDTE